MSSFSASPSAFMKRDHMWLSPPTSPVPVTENTKRAKKTEEEMVYLLIESVSPDGYAEYLIYKLDDSKEEQQPIWSMKETKTDPQLLPGMAVFSLDRKIYFCGGFLIDKKLRPTFKLGACMLDTISLARSVCSFEMYDASRGEWTSLPPLSYDLFDGFYDLKMVFMHDQDSSVARFTIKAWAVHDSYICISTLAALFVYSTEHDRWGIFSRPLTNAIYGSFNLPFLGSAVPLTFPNGNANENIFVAIQSYYPSCIVQVHRSPHWPSVKDFKPPAIFFPPSGVVECLSDRLDELPQPSLGFEDIFTFNSKPKLCIVRNGVQRYCNQLKRNFFMIHICDLILTEGAKVKATNTASYKIFEDYSAKPRHFFFAA